jgi:sulfate transport system substrate-binding protein
MLTVLAVVLLPFLQACASSQTDGAVRVALVAYSTPREAYARLIKAFQATPEGVNVTFDESYGGSTEQSLAVRNGLPADVVALSLEPDVTSLVDAGLVAPRLEQRQRPRHDHRLRRRPGGPQRQPESNR